MEVDLGGTSMEVALGGASMHVVSGFTVDGS